MPSKPKFDFDRIDRRTARVTPALIAAIRDRIVEHLQPEKIILFGSRAKGAARPESDIDLVLIVQDKHPVAALKRLDRFGAVLKLFHYRSFGLDALVLTEAESEQLRQENEGEWDLVLEILEEGRTIYECAPKENEFAFASTRARMVSQSRARVVLSRTCISGIKSFGFQIR
jgi:predicted nucleotidyltransferase